MRPLHLFAPDRADAATPPKDWDAERLARLAALLGAIGLEADGEHLARNLRTTAGTDLQGALATEEIARLGRKLRRKAAADVIGRLQLLSRFGAETGVVDAEKILAAAFEGFDDAVRLRAWLGGLWLQLLGRPEEAIAAFRSVPDDVAPAGVVLRSLHAALTALGRTEEADQLVRLQAERFGPAVFSPWVRVSYARSLIGGPQDADGRRQLAQLAQGEPGEDGKPVPPSVQRAAAGELATLARLERRYDDALTLLDQKIAQAPGSIPLETRRARMIFRAHGADAGFEALQPLLARAPDALDPLSAAIRLPFRHDQLRQIAAALPPLAPDALPARPVIDARLRLALRMGEIAAAQEIARLIPDDELGQLALEGHLQHSPRIGEREFGESGLHVVAGRADGPVVLVTLGVWNAASNVPIGFLDSWFARRDVTAVYLVDEGQQLLSERLLGATDGFADLAAQFLALPEVARARRKAVLGLSLGGLTAQHLALEIGAEASLLLAPKTTLGRPAPDTPDLSVEAIRPRGSTETLDLLAHWPADRPLPTEVHFGTGNKIDLAHVQRIADRPGVTLHPIAGLAHHHPLWPMIRSGAFDAALDRLLAPAMTEA